MISWAKGQPATNFLGLAFTRHEIKENSGHGSSAVTSMNGMVHKIVYK